MLARFWLRAWRKTPWLRHLYGRIYEPSTAARGVESWISSLRDSRASLPAQQEGASESRTTAGSGPRSPESFARYGPDGCFWRTFAGSYLPTMEPPSEKFSGTWPASGSMLSGECSARPRPERPTDESGCSSWPIWMTPTAQSGGSHPEEGHRLLDWQVKRWATPRGSDGEKGGPNSRDGSGSLHLPSEAVRWPIPQAHDGRRPGADEKSTQGANSSRDAATWQTPTAPDAAGRGYTYQNGDHSRPFLTLTGQAARSFHLDPTTPKGGGLTSSGGRASSPPSRMPRLLSLRLNPAFVEALMGLRIGWTALDSAETESSRSAPRLRSGNSLLASEMP